MASKGAGGPGPLIEDIKRCQELLEQQLAGVEGVLGIGIALSKKGSGLALNVLVANDATASRLPAKIQDVDVEYDIVGDINAL
ncbi:MAG: hypothetical protein AAF414_21155 [Pseudomonadota bacterium]